MIGTREQGVWITTNAGDQWQATSLKSGDVPCLAVNRTNPTIAYASSGASVYKSLDSGVTWKSVYTETQPGQGVACVVLNDAQPSVVWLLTTGGKLVRSDNEGRTWTLIQTLPAISPRLMYIDNDSATRTEKMYIFSRTRGLIVADLVQPGWQDLSKALKKFPGGMEINDIDVVQGSTTVWIMATKYGVLQSVDKGVTWTAIKTLVNPSSVAIQNVAINPRNFSEMYLTTNQKLHHTTDGGATWTVSSLPTSRTPVHLVFDPETADRMYFSTYRPVQK